MACNKNNSTTQERKQPTTSTASTQISPFYQSMTTEDHKTHFIKQQHYVVVLVMNMFIFIMNTGALKGNGVYCLKALKYAPLRDSWWTKKHSVDKLHPQTSDLTNYGLVYPDSLRLEIIIFLTKHNPQQHTNETFKKMQLNAQGSHYKSRKTVKSASANDNIKPGEHPTIQRWDIQPNLPQEQLQNKYFQLDPFNSVHSNSINFNSI